MMNLLNIACRITLLRIALVPGALLLMFLATPRAYLAAATVCAVAGVTDALDGYLARRYCGETRLGAILDLAADKFLILGTTSVLATQGLLPVWLPLVLILREAAVGGLRLKTSRDGTFLAPDAWGKAKTAISVIAIVGMLLHQGLAQEAAATLEGALSLAVQVLSLSWWAFMLAVGLSLFSGLRYFALRWAVPAGMWRIVLRFSKEPLKSLAKDF